MLHRVVGGVGHAFIAVGTVVLLFVAYQLWGTGFYEARAQSDLVEEFEQSLGEPRAAPAPAAAPTGDEPGEVQPPLPPPPGEAVAVLRIPKMEMEKVVVEGVSVADLRKAPGHYPQTPLPGQPGNAAIAGHRTTYGAPFWDLDQLRPGDEILTRTAQGEFRYEVDRTVVVGPAQIEVLDPTEEARLTLTTCHPRFSAAQRLVVSAVLVDQPAPATPVPAEPAPEPAPEPVTEPGPGTESVAEDAALSGDPAARVPAALWGSVVLALYLAIWVLGRAWRRWPVYLLGAPVLLVALLVFFEQVARLFPANV
ncbi:MAG: class E sortase [Actinomycetota bacterium]|nr:class E sortase [Actinomycetota bacterium]